MCPHYLPLLSIFQGLVPLEAPPRYHALRLHVVWGFVWRHVMLYATASAQSVSSSAKPSPADYDSFHLDHKSRPCNTDQWSACGNPNPREFLEITPRPDHARVGSPDIVKFQFLSTLRRGVYLPTTRQHAVLYGTRIIIGGRGGMGRGPAGNRLSPFFPSLRTPDVEGPPSARSYRRQTPYSPACVRRVKRVVGRRSAGRALHDNDDNSLEVSTHKPEHPERSRKKREPQRVLSIHGN